MNERNDGWVWVAVRLDGKKVWRWYRKFVVA